MSGFLNARHFLYAASLAPYLAEQPRWLRAVAAHVLTDEAYALTIAHFRRIGRTDMFGYWWAAIAVVFIPWNIATLVGVVIGGSIPDPAQFGLDIFFPAAMAGLAVGLIAGRRELVAALAGAAIGVSVGLLFDPAAGVVAGGLIGPLFGLIVPPSPEREISALAFERTPER